MELPVIYDNLTSITRKKVREAYIKKQEDKCCFCGKLLSGKPAKKVRKKNINKNLFPHNFFNYPIHLHHSHKTGLTIGAVHCECNAVLWQYYGE